MSRRAFELGRETSDGEFKRQQSSIRGWVTGDGSSEFPAAPGRYHLYVALACPWSHRAVIVRNVKGLEDVVSMSLLHPFRDDSGWAFPGEEYTDPINGFSFLSEAYDASDPSFKGRLTVPVLWDKETGRIVSNESADIVRMFGSAFDQWGDASMDLYPEGQRSEIDELNAFVYDNVNNGVYRTGFATSQDAYEAGYRALFDALPVLDERLAKSRYLFGDEITEADWRLFPTLVRFDAVYHTHFRCNGAHIVDYPNLWDYTRDLYQQPGIAETVRMDEIKRHYYTTHDMLNPKRIIPAGPEHLAFDAPHERARPAV